MRRVIICIWREWPHPSQEPFSCCSQISTAKPATFLSWNPSVYLPICPLWSILEMLTTNPKHSLMFWDFSLFFLYTLSPCTSPLLTLTHTARLSLFLLCLSPPSTCWDLQHGNPVVYLSNSCLNFKLPSESVFNFFYQGLKTCERKF